MANVNDWTTKAARRIRGDMDYWGDKLLPHDKEERIAAIIATFAEPLMTLLRESKRMHRHDTPLDEDETNDCCPQCACDSWIGTERIMTDNDEYPANRPGELCTCGAAEWNAKIDEVLK